ncbi:MAG TPA: DNA polymerase ligase N-terminal domain-containing protein [Labilithrix sp.]|nr:DNA polymerase ligase N-terminal domain-containing protein [Labilithrix sp.]
MARDSRKLGTYRDKRSAGVTNEPFGDEAELRAGTDVTSKGATEAGAFVVHLHAATRTHYDVRLEVGGVLWSFAVPHGPSLDPAKKVLAVKTEDHPIEYLDFEDVIPEGQYGAGPMIAWDRGAVAYLEGPAEDEITNGKLHVELRGMKLRGRWAFVKLAKGETGNEWLLFKKDDASADPSRAITQELPRSVLSGLTIDQLPEREAIERQHLHRVGELGGKEDDSLIIELCARIAPSPLTAIGGEASERKSTTQGSFYDASLDGVRVVAVRDGDVVLLRTWERGSCERIEAFYPDVVRALRALPMTRLAFDGELVAFDATGHPSLPLIAQRVARMKKGELHRAVTTTPVVLVVNDVLALGGFDVRTLPIESRRSLVADLLPSVGFLRAATPLEGERARILSTCASLGIATVIAKPKGRPYGDASSAWTALSTGLSPRARSAIDHGTHDAQATLRKVVVSNREKIFWPEDRANHVRAYTKGDLVDYYAAVADVLVPYLVDRPVILVRYPDGIEGKSFYQWNVPVGMPPWIRTLSINEVDETLLTAPSPRQKSREKPPPSQKVAKRGFLVDDPSTLIYIANLGCIPLHVLASRAPDLSRADFLTIDFDVKQSELRHAVTLARTLRQLLDEIGLLGFPKTSGQTGLHVLVPLGPNQSFDTARALADLLGRLLVELHPKIATMDRTIMRRGERVYVDTGQTGTSRAIVAPYSVRAVRGATVSTPLTWDEVAPDLDPRGFTIETVVRRIRTRGDLLKGLLGTRPDVAGAVGKLGELLPSITGAPGTRSRRK